MDNDLVMELEKKIQEAENALDTMQNKYDMEQQIDKMKRIIKELKEDDSDNKPGLRERAADLMRKVANMIGG